LSFEVLLCFSKASSVHAATAKQAATKWRIPALQFVTRLQVFVSAAVSANSVYGFAGLAEGQPVNLFISEIFMWPGG